MNGNFNYTEPELEARHALRGLKANKRYIAVSLWPPKDHTTIQPDGNTMYINEGRDGKFFGVSEAFYDRMVRLYDSRK